MTIPRTFIAGRDGEGVERADGLQETGLRVVVIEDAGHSMMVDQPGAFVRELVAALLTVRDPCSCQEGVSRRSVTAGAPVHAFRV
jgi:hypothetical protein